MERELREDEGFAARFEELAEPPPGGRGHRRLWLFTGILLFLVPAVTVVHPGVGVLLLVSVLSMGAAMWVGRRGDDRGPFGRGGP